MARTVPTRAAEVGVFDGDKASTLRRGAVPALCENMQTTSISAKVRVTLVAPMAAR